MSHIYHDTGILSHVVLYTLTAVSYAARRTYCTTDNELQFKLKQFELTRLSEQECAGVGL